MASKQQGNYWNQREKKSPFLQWLILALGLALLAFLFSEL